jgi:hypothetical protein
MIAAKSRHKKPDMAPVNRGGTFVRIDTKAGRLSVVGLPDDSKAFVKSIRLNVDLFGMRAGWIDFRQGGKIVGEDREKPPEGAGSRDGPSWGLVVDIASPYPTTLDGHAIDGISEHALRVTSSLALEAFNSLWDAASDAAEEAGEGDPVVVVEVASWTKINASSGPLYRPEFAVVGFVDSLDTALED